MRLHFLLLAQIAVLVVQEVAELLARVLRADKVYCTAFFRIEHSDFFHRASEVVRRATLAVNSESLRSCLADVCDCCQITLIARLGVTHPLLSILITDSAFCYELDDNVPHELLSLIN